MACIGDALRLACDGRAQKGRQIEGVARVQRNAHAPGIDKTSVSAIETVLRLADFVSEREFSRPVAIVEERDLVTYHDE
jgi:hypothetical protein